MFLLCFYVNWFDFLWINLTVYQQYVSHFYFIKHTSMQSQAQNLAQKSSQPLQNQSFYNQNVSLPKPTYNYPVPPIQI
jgi:hypothetical protein